jgi:hypothetical protein
MRRVIRETGAGTGAALAVNALKTRANPAHFQAQGAPGGTPLPRLAHRVLAISRAFLVGFIRRGPGVSQKKPSEILVVDAELKILQQKCNALRSGGYEVVPTSG